MKKQQATEYMYASARVRALESYMVGQERLPALVDAKDKREVLVRLSEYGEIYHLSVPTHPGVDALALSQATEEMLLSLLTQAYREVWEAVPDIDVYRHFKYPYDCNNVKAVLKGEVRGADVGDMLFDFGSVSVHELTAAFSEERHTVLPTHMAKAVVDAKEAYAQTADPQVIDKILDRACYADMLESAERCGCDAICDWVREKIDLTNIMICLRILRLKRGETGKLFMKETLIEGGHLPLSFFEDAYDNGEDALLSSLGVRYDSFATEVASSDRSLATIEKLADDQYMRIVKRDAKVPFGAEVAGGYLVGWEMAVKNIRIILAAKDAGISADVVRERLRESYV